ncbi:hypothetical protein Tsedi_00820 [Tepidimonas sediminis]|uniref:Uncharacterized protein n=1 Tax=Tepidimonas sediminis TaxID=2588941 RepID=A0A554WSF2_9BURK|nr:hypothetical protein Tsedi_00820 [Tepidimonas sediminis]
MNRVMVAAYIPPDSPRIRGRPKERLHNHPLTG